MPYKDPERKRQWEREHREQRNALRRLQRLPARSGHGGATSDILAAMRTRRKPAPDTIPATETKSGWKVVAGIGAFALVVGLVILSALDGVSVPGSDCS